MKKEIAVVIGVLLLAICFFGEAAQIEVVNLTWYKEKSPHVEKAVAIGEVKNKSDKNLYFRVGATFLSDIGEVEGVGTDNYGFNLRPIRPNERLPFRVYIKGDNLNIAEVKININKRKSYTDGTRKVKAIKTKGFAVTKELDKFYKVTGLIENISNKQVSGLYVLGSFYDEEGNIISVSQGKTSIPFADLDSGDTIGFEMLTSRRVKEIKNYKIIAGELGGS